MGASPNHSLLRFRTTEADRGPGGAGGGVYALLSLSWLQSIRKDVSKVFKINGFIQSIHCESQASLGSGAQLIWYGIQSAKGEYEFRNDRNDGWP